MAVFEVRKSSISGKGLFATRDIAPGETIGIVKGPVVPNNEESCKKYDINYLHPISHRELIVNTENTKYTNHSCDPNCGMGDAVTLVAMKLIKKDEEITVDYDMLEYDWQMPCNCGKANCRKMTRGFKYLSEELKKKYSGFISPYLVS